MNKNMKNKIKELCLNNKADLARDILNLLSNETTNSFLEGLKEINKLLNTFEYLDKENGFQSIAEIPEGHIRVLGANFETFKEIENKYEYLYSLKIPNYFIRKIIAIILDELVSIRTTSLRDNIHLDFIVVREDVYLELKEVNTCLENIERKLYAI